jgi:2,3-bisphosphoglycerate-dependent phosphoglycerate mutase
MENAMRQLEAAFLIGVEGTTEIWLVRHADCYEGMEEEPDPPLSPRGREQARRLAQRVRQLQPAAIYTSPALRAQQTAAAISDDARVDARLTEMTFELGDDGAITFTEKPEDVIARMGAAIDEIANAHPGERVVVIGHAGAILGYVCDVMRLEPGRLRLLPYYTSVTVVRALGDRKMVGALGDTAHLE